MTPYFSGGSTIKGATGGYRWARVLGGQIGWLLEPLHVVDADCSGSLAASGRVLGHKFENVVTWKTRKNPPHTKHTTKSSAARRPRPPRDGAQKKHVSRVSPYSRASMDTGFVEIGLVQFSQSVKTTNVAHTYTHSSLPSLFRFRFGHRLFSSCLFLVGTMLSPRFRGLLRLVKHMICILIRTYADLTFLFLSEVCYLFQGLCVLSSICICFPPEVFIRSRVIGACPVTTDCIAAMG